MADEINVDKLKRDAFDAIDALFIEDDQKTSVIEEQISTEPQSTGDDFSILKEYSLALDWEYSDKELERLAVHLEKIALKNPNQNNHILVKLVNIIIQYLQKAREKSFPQTLSVMTSVIDTIRDINTKDLSKDQIKFEVNSAKKEVRKLKYNISNYNQKLQPHSHEKQNTAVLERLDHLEEKISYLEKQNTVLKQIIIDQHQEAASMEIPDLDSGIKDETDKGLNEQNFPDNNELFSDIEEPVTVQVEDISFDVSNESNIDIEQFVQKDVQIEEIALQVDNLDSQEPDTKQENQDYSEYVKLFKIDKHFFALPENIINNIYRIPSKIKNKIYSMESIPLKNLSSLFQKLSKNMKGALHGTSNSDLEKIDAMVKILDTSTTKYNYAVLCSVDDIHVIVPVTGQHKNKSILATGKNKKSSNISEYSVEINGMGSIPIVIPC